MACALAVCQDPHPPLDGVVPPALARYVDRLLAKEPTDRPASATAARSELADVLARLRNTRSDPDATDDYSSDAVILLPEAARSYTITQDLQAILADPVRRRPKRWPWVVPLGVVGLVALGAATVALQSGTDPTPPTGPPVAVVTPTTTPDPGASDPQPPQAAPTLLDCTGPNGVTSDVVAAARAGWARHLGVSVEATVPLGDRAAMTFALVPPGTFTMGSPTDETDRGENELSHRVTLTRPYFMGVTEVTQAQYRAITGQNPSTFSGDERPVEQVTWDDAVAFAAELTARRDDGFVYRLPTEAEWEYAGRAGRPAGLPFGIGTGTDLSADEANFDGRSPYGARVAGEYRQATTPVGSFGANAFGLDDMHGNVWEWCRDTYAEYPSGPGTDPTGPNDGLRKVHRGGSWQDAGYACRAARRDWDDADAADPRIGFRLVRVLQD